MRVLSDGLTFPPHVPAFYDHNTDEDPIGHWVNFRRDGQKWLADLVFNDITPRGKEICDMIDAGHIGQASVGIDMRYSKLSRLPKDLADGQTRPTFTKSFAPEISAVKLAANRSAIALYDDGIQNRINFSDGADPLSKYDFSNDNNTFSTMKKLTRKFNLADDATEDMVLDKITDVELQLSDAKAELKRLKDAQTANLKAETKTLLDKAVSENRIAETERASYEKLFDMDFEATKTVLAARTANVVKLSHVANVNGGGGSEAPKYLGKTWKELRESNPKGLTTLKAENPVLFKLMYKADYGVEWVD